MCASIADFAFMFADARELCGKRIQVLFRGRNAAPARWAGCLANREYLNSTKFAMPSLLLTFLNDIGDDIENGYAE